MALPPFVILAPGLIWGAQGCITCRCNFSELHELSCNPRLLPRLLVFNPPVWHSGSVLVSQRFDGRSSK